MKRTRNEITVGLFVFIGLLLLAALLIEFSKTTSPFRGTYELRLHADNVGGLKLHAAVLLAGVNVGNVSNIRLAPDGKSVTVLLRIYEDYRIFHDARFVIQQSGFLGDQYVAIIPTSNQPPVLTNDAEVECEAPFNLQETARSAAGFIVRIDETAKKLDAAVGDVRRLVLNEETLTNFAAAIGNLRAVTEQATNTVANLNDLVADNGTQINLAVSNVVYFSQDLIRLSDNARDLISTNGTGISASIKNIQGSTEDLKKLMDNLRSGQGAAGALLANEQLSNNVQALAANLAVTTSNLNEYGLWHILWHHQQPESKAAPPTTRSPRAEGQQ